MVIVVDDEDRENEGDLTMAAEKVTPEAINFMATHGRGLICLPMTGERLDKLEIPLMVTKNSTRFETAFCVPIEAKRGTSTGISAADRAATVRAAINPKTKPVDLARPGHMFPLRARDGGVLVRAGQTEAAVDLARIAGLDPAGVICEIMNDDGTMARVPALTKFAQEAQAADDHDRGSDPLSDADRRPGHESGGSRPADRARPVPHPRLREPDRHETHLALVCGDIGDGDDVLVRVHSKCLTGDVFHSARCDCGMQLEAALQQIAARRPRRAAVSEPGRPRHRPGQQAARLRAAGSGARHRRSQRAPRVQGRPARLRHRRADPRATSASARCAC